MARMFKELPMNDELERLLKECTNRPVTNEELFEQKVSFVYGQMMDCCPDVTKDEIRERLRKS